MGWIKNNNREKAKNQEHTKSWMRYSIIGSNSNGKNIPVSGSLLQEKARILHEQLYPNSFKSFVASTGFQWRFSKRHGLKNLAIQEEQASFMNE